MIYTPIEGPRWLLRQLGRFRQALEGLIGRLRNELAQTVGRAVGEAVREVFQQQGGVGYEKPSPPPYRSSSSTWDRTGWDSSSDGWDEGNDEDRWGRSEEDYEPSRRQDEAAPNQDVQTPTGSRWSLAMMNGVRAGAWWLARMKNYPIAGAALAALVASLGTWFAGPALVSGAAGIALGLFGLADGLAVAASALND